jgi:L-ascorbate metabolism protein UlaG (beta-lactamase superfamily)
MDPARPSLERAPTNVMAKWTHEQSPLHSRRSVLKAVALAPLALATSARSVALPQTSVIAQRLAWAGVKLERPEVAVFIDAIAPDPPDTPGPALVTKAKRAFALVTHAHGDHCDPEAVKAVLGENGYIVAHEEVARYINPHGVVVQPVRYHEPVFLSRGGGEFVAWCVPASDGLGSPQASWVVDVGGKRIIHCGDTMWHGGFWDMARAYGPFAVAFLPINGMRQTLGRYTDVTEPMSMTPEQAAAAARTLNAAVAVPIHYGSRNNPAYVEAEHAPERFVREMKRLNCQASVLAPGDELSL